MISLDAARTEFMAGSGLDPAGARLWPQPGITDSMLATFLPLGIADNLWWGWTNEARLRQVWAIQDTFGCEQAEFVAVLGIRERSRDRARVADTGDERVEAGRQTVARRL